MIGFVVGNVGNPFFGDIRRERDLIEHLMGLKIAGLALAPSSFGPDYVKFAE
ncbi:MAG: LacI family transcriptional regulator, partial [Hyphomicrobiales bacterium]